MLDFNPIIPANPDPDKSRTIVRVMTRTWSDRKGIYQKKKLRYVKHRCEGESIFQQDIDVGEDVIPRIVNLNDCNDGLYQVVACNILRDFNTGYIDYFDYRLVPYT